jgi:hypothetical protein
MGRPAQRLTRMLLARNLLASTLVRKHALCASIRENLRSIAGTCTLLANLKRKNPREAFISSPQDGRSGVCPHNPFFCQLASLHIPACQCQRGGSVHAYHGSRDDEAAEQRQIHRAVREMREAAKTGKQPGTAPQHLPEGAARSAMRDPLAMLLTATGVPLGINMRMDPSRTPLTDAALSERLQAVKEAEQEAPAAEGSQSRRAAEVAARLSELVDSLPALLAQQSTQDTWGTTQESPAEIAQRIADSMGGEPGEVPSKQ